MSKTVPAPAKGKTITGRVWSYLRDNRRFAGGRAVPSGGNFFVLADLGKPPPAAAAARRTNFIFAIDSEVNGERLALCKIRLAYRKPAALTNGSRRRLRH